MRVKYMTAMTKGTNIKPNEIAHEDIELNKYFVEYLISEEYVRPYFMFDSMNEDVISWLKNISNVFGKYVIDDKGLVVFYETAIRTQELMDIMHSTAKKGFSTIGMNEHCRNDIYNLCSRKPYTKAIQMIEHKCLRSANEIITVSGYERTVSKDEWKQLFILRKDVAELVKPVAQTLFQIRPAMTKNPLTLVNETIEVEDNDMKELGMNERSCEGCLSQNTWFFRAVKKLSKERQKYFIEKYCKGCVNELLEIELRDTFTLKDLRRNKYMSEEGIDIASVINDLRRCVVVIDGARMTYLVKDYDGIRDTTTLVSVDSKEFNKLMKSVYVGRIEEKDVNALMIYEAGQNKNYLMKSGMRFFDERDDIYSYFRGYEYEVLNEVDESVIEGYLKHVHDVICNEDEELYEYVLNWFAYIVQNPCGKTGTVLLLTGKQGTGKNVLSNVLCELISKYANNNITAIENVVGRFNAAIENMKLIVCNELSSCDTSKVMNHDALKSIVTETQLDLNQKCQPVRKIENVCNIIMISNNFNSVKIDKDDRRFVVIDVSSRYKGNYEYFSNLIESFNEEFYSNLLTYFMKKDLSEFDVRKIPFTRAKQELIEMNKTPYQMFYEEFYEKFVSGWNCTECYRRYKEFAKENEFFACSSNVFGGKMREFVKRSRKRDGSARSYIYEASMILEGRGKKETVNYEEVLEKFMEYMGSNITYNKDIYSEFKYYCEQHEIEVMSKGDFETLMKDSEEVIHENSVEIVHERQ